MSLASGFGILALVLTTPAEPEAYIRLVGLVTNWLGLFIAISFVWLVLNKLRKYLLDNFSRSDQG